MADRSVSYEISKENKVIAGISTIGGGIGLLVSLFVAFFARQQYRVASQYLTFENNSLTITAGYYYRLLSYIYFIIAISAIVGGLLMFTTSHNMVGQYLLLEIYTIGVIRALFALLAEDRYYILGKTIMSLLVMFGLVMLAFLSKPDRYRKHTLIFGLQIILGLILIIVIPIEIMDPIPSLFFND